MDSILNWYREEGVIFKGGSGVGHQPVQDPLQRTSCCNGGGTARGPVSFMRGADASAGTIKCGGKTRRAAKMVILNVDHPDVEEFIWCKAKEERKARVLRDAGFDMDLDGADSLSHPVPERQQLGAGHRRVHAGRDRRRRLGPEGRHRRRDHAHGAGPRPVARDRHGGVGVRRPRPAVRHHDQHVAHRARHRADQRLEPVLRVHAPRQLGLQPRLDQPAQVPRRRTARSTSRASGTPSRSIFTAQEILVGRADYPTESIAETSRLPPARPRLRQPRRHADGARPALRLRRRPGVGGRRDLAHDRPRLRHERPHRQPHGPLRRVRRQRGAHAARAAHAPRRRRRDRRRAGARPSCSPPPRRRGTTPCATARSSAFATARPACSPPPARSV